MSDFDSTSPTKHLAYAFGGPCVTGLIKQQPQDFRVDEIPGFEPDGEGDHVYLTIEKTGLTTNNVAGILKRYCGLHSRDIGYAGMKDKHAVTSQQFSINLSGKVEPDWSAIENDQIRVLNVARHRRKLKRGVLKGNRFTIVIRELQGDLDKLVQQLEKIKQHGVPNYFGPQRFGYAGSNIEQARRLFRHELPKIKRDERSILLSTARSLLFNQVLHERVKQGNWNRLLPGEVINLDATERHFAEPINETLISRTEQMDVHPTGPLCGLPSRALQPTEEAGNIEQQVLEGFDFWLQGLEQFKLEHARRPLRIAVRDMQWSVTGNQMSISFALTAGAYATVVLREFLKD